MVALRVDTSFGLEGGSASAIIDVAIAREALHVRLRRHFVKAGPMGAEYMGVERSRDPADWLELVPLVYAGSGSEPREDGTPSGVSSPSVVFTHSSTVLGTPAYMAPEQAAADAHVDHRADLYAWGVVAYETLTGRHPFRGASGAANPPSHYAAYVPVPILGSVPNMPGALAALVMRCLERAPSDRPRSAAEVLAALDSVAMDVRSAGAERTTTDRPSQGKCGGRVWHRRPFRTRKSPLNN